jgi:hypothetical protein
MAAFSISCFPGHAELSRLNPDGDILGGPAAEGDLEIVDDAGAVQGDAAYPTVLHQANEDGIQSHLDDVGA